MSVTKSYNRQKAAPTISTGLVFTLLVAELPDSLGAIGGTGTTGNLTAAFRADLDESGGSDVQDVFTLVTGLAVDASSGVITLTVTVTPVNGDATNGTPQVLTVTHPQTADVLQTAGGRARQ